MAMLEYLLINYDKQLADEVEFLRQSAANARTDMEADSWREIAVRRLDEIGRAKSMLVRLRNA
jgi:hypothetical protein